ncbi:NADP-dependent oxidoreductase [Cumulibacter manganitolerans]|uniref:NADP-dependent oxidoreductase n=1 Tax=Cumulibacter manganitolerans TaxID=1884992 RepID=UPI0012952B53|nr:NADP-dependent oxidoreductase [Cumulibacter manganitolerans]
MTDTTRIVLAGRPTGEPTHDDFRTETVALPEPRDGEVLLKTRYLSLDPYMRGRMNDAKSYAAQVEIGDPMVGGTVSEVLESRADGFAPGDVVLGYAGWQTHSVEKAAGLFKLDQKQPLSTALGVLGMPGFTAYAGLLILGKPQPGETVVVAAATGPVGSAVGQIARIKGARAVGIAGGPEKVAYLKELGFDAAVDHRADDFVAQLEAATPDGIDVYFENVGGKVWDAVLPRMNEFGRVPVCGLVSGYNATALPEGPNRVPALMGAVLQKSLTLRGFIQREFADQMPQFRREMSQWIEEGKVQYREDITDGLENAVDAFIGMLRGANFGKVVIKVAE